MGIEDFMRPSNTTTTTTTTTTTIYDDAETFDFISETETTLQSFRDESDTLTLTCINGPMQISTLDTLTRLEIDIV